MDVIFMTTKKCRKCNQVKQYTDFWVDKRLSSGRMASCKECLNSLQKMRYKEKNKNRISKKPRKKTPEELKEYRRKWYSENKDRYKEYRKKYCKNRNKWQQERTKNNTLFRMRRNISGYMRRIIKSNGKIKSQKMEQILGIKFKEYTEYLESLFEEGMNWDNWSVDGWHIDHITPLCSATNEKELLDLLHYSNTRPLWAKDNLSKGGKLE